MGQPAMTLGKELQEHFRAPSPIHDHTNPTGHHASVDNFSIVGRESNNITRTIKDVMYIRFNVPSLSRSIGKSFSCPTYGMRFYSTPLTSDINKTPPQLQVFTVHDPHPLRVGKGVHGAHTLCKHFTTIGLVCCTASEN